MSNLSNLLNLHSRIAVDLHAKGEIYQLHCEKCDRTEVISEADYAKYLAHGWPLCCARTMSLEKLR